MITRLAFALRRSKLFQNRFVKTVLKSLSLIFSRVVYGRYRKINIGDSGDFYLDSRFAFHGYENWGSRHNVGFNKLIDLSKSKNIIFDVGAHIGLCAMPLSRVANKVIGFEGSAENENYLRSHIAKNDLKNIEIISKLVGDKHDDHVKFYEVDGGSGVPSIADLNAIKKQKGFTATEQIKQQITIDDYVKETNNIPDVIKIDVEGAEFKVIDGALKTITKYKPDIVISLHPTHLKSLGSSAEEIFTYCDQLDYELLSCEDGHKVAESELALSEYYMKPLVKSS